ncbi:MAG: helix-turn-helix transcriptional regulator, partial [Gammaproteobacteria bacterium]
MDCIEDVQALTLDYLDAALDPAQWPAVLERTAHRLDSVGVDLHLLRDGTNWASYMGAQPADVLNEYTERFFNREPRSLTLQHLRPGQVVTDLDFVDRETMRTHEYYTDFLRRNGMGHCIAAAPLHNGGNQAYFGVHFAHGKAPPDAARMACVRALLPCLERAVQVQYRLAETALRKSLCSEALDRVGTGVAVLDGARRVLIENAPARAALADTRCLRVQNRRIVPVAAQEAARFDGLCKAAVARHATAGGAMLIEGTHGRPCYSVLVHPVDAEFRERTGAAAFVFLASLERPPDPDFAARLRGLFRLTPAEARIAGAMLEGEVLRATAERLGITYETARFTLRQVYAKVGVNKQSQLVAALG